MLYSLNSLATVQGLHQFSFQLLNLSLGMFRPKDSLSASVSLSRFRNFSYQTI